MKVLIGTPSKGRAHRMESLEWVKQCGVDWKVFVEHEQLEAYAQRHGEENIIPATTHSIGAKRQIILEYARLNGYEKLVMVDDDYSCVKEKVGTTTGGYSKYRKVADYRAWLERALEVSAPFAIMGIARTRWIALACKPEVNFIVPNFIGDIQFINPALCHYNYPDSSVNDSTEFQLGNWLALGKRGVGLCTAFSYETPNSNSRQEEGGLAMRADFEEQSHAEALAFNARFPQYTQPYPTEFGGKIRWNCRITLGKAGVKQEKFK